MKFVLISFLFSILPLILFNSCSFKDENFYHRKKRVLVISPHQDDEANMANAIMYRRAKQGDDIYVVVAFGSSPKDNYDEYGLGRLRESAKNMKYLGLNTSNLIYLGYQNLPYAAVGKGNVIVTNSLGEILKEDGTPFTTFSHIKEGFPSFHCVKYGNECTVSEDHLLSDLVDLFQQYKPDEIYAINYDKHPDHIYLGSLVEQAFGVVKLRTDYENYCPRFYQSMSYQSSWYSEKDMISVFSPNDSKRNILESTLPFKPLNSTFEWNKRIRFPVDDKMSIPDINSNLSTLAYMSGFGNRVAERLLAVVNGDQIFWERDTRNKAFKSSIIVSSNDKDKNYLNDFSTTRVPFKNISKLKFFNDDNLMLKLCDCYKWSPEDNDTNKIITLIFKKPLDISAVRLYDDFRLENQIVSGLLTFSDGSSIPVGELNNCGSATLISFPTKNKISSIRFQIKEYKGTPGLTEFEVYSPEKQRSPDFIQIYLSATNNQKWKTQSFLYDYYVDISQQPQTMQLSVYRYPDETPKPNYNWQIVGEHEGLYFKTNGILHVEQSTLPGIYTIKVSENDWLTDTITLNVVTSDITHKKAQNQAEEGIKGEISEEEIIDKDNNLFINGDFTEGIKSWNYDKDVNIIREDGKNIVELIGSQNDQTRIWQRISMISGHVYRLSFELKADQGGALAIFRDNSKGEESYLFTGESKEWKTFKKDFKSYKNGQYMIFLSCKAEGKFYYSNASLTDITKE